MEVSSAILKRASIRRWKPVPVEKEKIEKVLEAGRRAPSWGNTQPWRFIVVQDKAKIEEIAKAAGGQPHINAPVLIVCCGAINDLSRKMHRETLAQLRDAGVTNWTDDFLDNVVLKSDAFAPYLLGEPVMTVKAGEQVMIAVAYMTLEAVNQGLGTCWVGAITPKEVHKVMNLPDNIFVQSLLPLGYPGEDPKPRPRKDASKIIFWEKYE
ncbi:MAG TPA: nitroreductase family protein [Dehalococcoidales bacterium]|nr:nitroreductase family protein [Dehalococcoidales bacterium]